MTHNHWTQTTAECYFRNMVCKGCINEEACKMGEECGYKKTQYGLRNIKELVLKIYANVGKPKRGEHE